MCDWLKRRTIFTSPDNQNEVLSMFSHAILRNIINDVKENVHFSIIIDGTQDITGTEQESICFRYVDNQSQPHS